MQIYELCQICSSLNKSPQLMKQATWSLYAVLNKASVHKVNRDVVPN
jgi:hypothetical protein